MLGLVKEICLVPETILVKELNHALDSILVRSLIVVIVTIVAVNLTHVSASGYFRRRKDSCKIQRNISCIYICFTITLVFLSTHNYLF